MTTLEIWKDILGYENIYQVSNLGNVKSLKSNKVILLKQTISSNGYYSVSLFDKKTKTHTVHSLVAVAFLNHSPKKHRIVINHKDFNKLNNNVLNLELVTQRENGNMKHLKSSSKYTGVVWHKQAKKWQSGIVIKRKYKYLGLFEDEYDAHLAYENKLKELIINY